MLRELHAEGLARAISVSNFRSEDLAVLLAGGGPAPGVNQIELHPYQQQRLRARHAELGIVTEAWAPLSQGRLLRDPVLLKHRVPTGCHRRASRAALASATRTR